MNELKTVLEKSGLVISEAQLNKFDVYYKTLIEWNRKMNLTAITDKTDVYHKHFLDSIILHKTINLNQQTLLDVGSGAGFPSIPLKILFPELEITILDSLNKRITFLKKLSDQLDIKVNLVHGRAEDFEHKNHFDIVTARAVAPLNKLLELTLPFVKKNGVFVSYKGSNYKQEIDVSKNALNKLKGSIQSTFEYRIYDESRVLIKIHKNDKTAQKYPRSVKQIKNNPL